MNKIGKTDLTTVLLIALVLGGGYYLVTSMQDGEGPKTGLVPADLKTTITLNTKDALATSSTIAPVNYYVFKANTGEFIKEGTTNGDGQDAFDVQYGGSYKIIAYNDTSATSGAGFLPEEITFVADNEEGSLKTINMELNKVGGLQIIDVRDPVDLNGNISYGAGSTQSFQILYKNNVSNAAVLNPTIVLEGNRTGIDSDGIKIVTSGYSSVDCPNRLTLRFSANRFWCFKYNGVVTSSDGIQTVDGTIKFDDTSSPGTTSHLGVYLLDEQQVKKANYIQAGSSAFYTAAEDTADADVGAVDSTSDFVGYAG